MDAQEAKPVEYPDCYLHIRECRSGQEWIKPIRRRQILNLRLRIQDWCKEDMCGELALDGAIMPKLDGDYYAKIITDGRPPDSPICWDGGGFYLKTTY